MVISFNHMYGPIIICPAEAVPSGILYSGSTWNTALEFSQRWLGAQCSLSPAKLANSMIIFKNNCYHIEIARDSGGNTLNGHLYGSSPCLGECSQNSVLVQDLMSPEHSLYHKWSCHKMFATNLRFLVGL